MGVGVDSLSDSDHDRRPQVFATRLLQSGVVGRPQPAEVLRNSFTEPCPTVAGHDRDEPRPCPFVVRSPRDQLAESDHEILVDVARAVDRKVCPPCPHDVFEVFERFQQVFGHVIQSVAHTVGPVNSFERELDVLFEVSPDHFVEERDALVKRLKVQKRRDDAAAVRLLRRPTPLVWSMNQAARRQPHLSGELVRLGAAALAAQAALLSGGSAATVFEIVEQRRDVITGLLQTASQAAEEHGLASPSLAPQLRNAFELVSVSAEASSAFLIGQLATVPTQPDDPPTPSTQRVRHLRSVATEGESGGEQTAAQPETETAIETETQNETGTTPGRVATDDEAPSPGEPPFDGARAEAHARLAQLQTLTEAADQANASVAEARTAFAETSVVAFETTTALRDAVAAVNDVAEEIAALERRRTELLESQRQAEVAAELAEVRRAAAQELLEQVQGAAKTAERALADWHAGEPTPDG